MREKQDLRLNREMGLIANKANLKEVEEKKVKKIRKEREEKQRKFKDQKIKNYYDALEKKMKKEKVNI